MWEVWGHSFHDGKKVDDRENDLRRPGDVTVQ